MAVSDRLPLSRHSRSIWSVYHMLQSIRAIAQSGCLGSCSGRAFQSFRWRYRNDRQLLCPCSSTCGDGKKGDQDDGCMGRSRGGLTTKIHAVVDADGRPIRLALTAGQAHDGRMAEPLLQTISKGAILLADKAYDTNAIQAFAKQRQAWANIPTKSNRKGSFPFSQWVYRQRNLVERFFSKLKQFRGIATRYDKDPMNFLAVVKLAAARIWIRSL